MKRYQTDQTKLERVLISSHDAITKVRQIMTLGFDQEVAEDIVERHQLGQQMPVYYERLPLSFAPDKDDY